MAGCGPTCSCLFPWPLQSEPRGMPCILFRSVRLSSGSLGAQATVRWESNQLPSAAVIPHPVDLSTAEAAELRSQHPWIGYFLNQLSWSL